MAIVIACIGQKGGSGKSIIARALVAEATRKKRTAALADLDVGQHTSADWNAARVANKLEPALSVEIVDPDEEHDLRVPELARKAAVVVLDAPGLSDDVTVRVATAADLIVIPAAPSTDDLRPAMRLCHELAQCGIAPERIIIVLNRIRTDAEEKFARGYLEGGKLGALKDALADQPIYRKAGNVGNAITEVSSEGPRENARAVAAVLLAMAEKLSKVAKAKPLEKPKRFVLEEGESW